MNNNFNTPKKRILIVMIGIFIMFLILILRLYVLQILNGEKYLSEAKATSMREISIEAQRGNIYDKWGIPLSENQVIYNLKMDLSKEYDDINYILLNIVRLLNSNNENINYTLPITENEPFEYTFSSEAKEIQWKKDMGIYEDTKNMTASELYDYLKKKFNINITEITHKEECQLISLRSEIYIMRYKKYNDIVIAEDLKFETVSKLEENAELYSGLYVEEGSKRVYTFGESFSHMLGYVGSINDTELQEYEQYGYNSNDKIGKIGIEKYCELILNGEDGTKMIEVDSLGRRINEIEISEPKNGGDVFLSIDSYLQKELFYILENNLKDVLIQSINSGETTKEDIIKSIEENGIVDEERLNEIRECNINEIKNKIISNDIRLNEINIQPCTGSAVVLDINTGKPLALVTYPSYDNNNLVNTFDSDYYNILLEDNTTPLINRALMERKAPGSVFKMLSAIVGLETGVINENTIIYDEGVYKNAGSPYAKCLIYSRYGTTHGKTDVKKALEVSCNYYFYEVAYRLGNSKNGNTLNSIETFNKYMEMFGLNDYTGIEIEESKPIMASPEIKKQSIENYYENPTASQKKWSDGDSIRCAIGQSYNSYSVMNIAKYISIIANNGIRYKTSIINGIKEYGATDINYYAPKIESNIDISSDTFRIVKEGMYQVTHGTQGSLRNYFKEFPVEVAAKTGTAEEAKNMPSHSWFAGFAPYDNPQIAVVVMVPYGELPQSPATKTAQDIITAYFGLNKNKVNKNIYENGMIQ